jgi:hypothetical protein
MCDAQLKTTVDSRQPVGGVITIAFLLVCLSGASTAAEPAKADARPAAPKADNTWYLLTSGTCDPQDPASLLALGQLLGQSMTSRDVKQQGKVVATTISADDGSTAKFYRGKARCEAAAKQQLGDLTRYD